jgi:cell division transport system permease protein
MLKNLKREKLLVISNISAMTVTFVLLGVFISIIALSQTALRSLEKQAQITLFFKDDFPETSIGELETRLNQDQRILETNYVSKEDAYAIFSELNKEEPILLESISASILPASLEIKTKNLDDLPVLSEELSNIDGVEEVKFFQDVIEKFKNWSNIAYTLGFILVGVFLTISFAVIMITLRLTIAAKGEELEILKLVGASDEYVKKPLIQQGVFFGLTSGLLASAILLVGALVIQLTGTFTGKIELGFMPDLLLSITVFMLLLSFVLIALGFALGYFGSLAAIRKYLKY